MTVEVLSNLHTFWVPFNLIARVSLIPDLTSADLHKYSGRPSREVRMGRPRSLGKLLTGLFISSQMLEVSPNPPHNRQCDDYSNDEIKAVK